MQRLSEHQRARLAIRIIKTTSDALALRGYYKPAGRSGQTLADGLRMLSPEIYGSMNSSRIIELKGLEYVLERLPAGIERCNRIILTDQEELEDTSFEKIIPPKRRRISYRVGKKEMCFVITRGLSEIYDLLTHLTFLDIEAHKIYRQMKDREGNSTREWKRLEEIISQPSSLSDDQLDQAFWNLSILLGRTFHETKASYEALEKYSKEMGAVNILFHIIYGLGKRVEEECDSRDNELLISFTPSLRDMIGTQRHCETWAADIKRKIRDLGFHKRPIHIISANLHSIVNVLYAYGALKTSSKASGENDLYEFIKQVRTEDATIKAYALQHGLHELPDTAGTQIDCQLIDSAKLDPQSFHPAISIRSADIEQAKPVILVMDYAFGVQAFEAMDELLEPLNAGEPPIELDVQSISVMGKAGILPGQKGDIMLPTAHVFEGTAHNYIVKNDLDEKDFDRTVNVYTGPIVTVFGTSLQNRNLLKRFQTSSWNAVGLEMEGGHYQRAINSAIIRRHIADTVKTRYAYYASDNPLLSGQTLASGAMGEEGIRPTYMITKIILEKIFQPPAQGADQ